ncbi:phytoene synthase [Chitinivorax tropicus]|uniref:Phytoene synthase n=1 Tax=Chitinivorax tropicus TaxID=714531 RepID=A0A840MIK2_9PROT|nr:squalene/phytoene synthase family protein [Chitinivorax tropicus]MBB5018478.1 phytoene synthase [Chitinivorax tropicus]
MDFHQYCEQKAAPVGSAFYYALRGVPISGRRGIVAIYALSRELHEGLDECSDATIAEAKLAWWATELDRWAAGRPEHPVTKALHDAVPQDTVTREQLQEMLDGVEMNLRHARYNDFKGLRLYCHRHGGVAMQLAAQMLGCRDKQTMRYAHELGVALSLSELVLEAGAHLRKGIVYWPVEDLQRFEVPAADLLALKVHPNLAALVEFQLARALTHLSDAAKTLPPAAEARSLRYGRILAAIAGATLGEVKAAGANCVLNQRVSLTPIRKLWIALKTR